MLQIAIRPVNTVLVMCMERVTYEHYILHLGPI